MTKYRNCSLHFTVLPHRTALPNFISTHSETLQLIRDDYHTQISTTVYSQILMRVALVDMGQVESERRSVRCLFCTKTYAQQISKASWCTTQNIRFNYNESTHILKLPLFGLLGDMLTCCLKINLYNFWSIHEFHLLHQVANILTVNPQGVALLSHEDWLCGEAHQSGVRQVRAFCC